MPTPLDSLIEDYSTLYQYLVDNGEISLAVDVENYYKKIFLLSCASYYEKVIQEIIQAFVAENSKDDRVFRFLSNKAIKRQYHTYFSWESANINTFLGLFGTEFKDRIAAEIKEAPDLENGVRAFLTIGNERNKMVHEDFLSYSLGKTFPELKELNRQAFVLIEYIRSIF